MKPIRADNWFYCLIIRSTTVFRPSSRFHHESGPGLPIPEGDRPGFVRQKNVHVPCSLNGSTAHRKNIMLNQPLDARNAYGANKAAGGGGYETYQQGYKDGALENPVRIDAERLEGSHHYDEKDGEGSEQYGEGDFVGRFLPLGAFDRAGVIWKGLGWNSQQF